MKINEFIKYEECAWNWSLTSTYTACKGKLERTNLTNLAYNLD